MAIDYAGLFADPNEIRNKRIQDMMAERQGIAQMGGSMSQLLGQVAAGGAATGRALAEQTAGMFGLKDPAEQKAGQLQQMSQNFDTTTSTGLTAFAKALNDAGMTREAVLVLQQRDKVLASERETEKYGFYKEDRERSEQDRQRLIAQGKLRERRETVMVEKLDSKGKPTGIMEPKTVYYTEVWDEKNQRWVRESGSGAGGQAGGAYGGITVIDPKTGMATMTQGDPAVDGYKEDLTISP